MLWPTGKNGARILRIARDEAEGELFISVSLYDGAEQDIVYEGMYYSQLDESSEGITVTLVTEITPVQLKQPEHEKAASLLYDDCGRDDAFLREMHRRGNHLYVHRTKDGGEYIVLARRLAFGETRPGPPETGNDAPLSPPD